MTIQPESDRDRLVRLGATEDEIAQFYGVERSEDEYLEFAAHLLLSDRRGVIAARKRKRSATRRDRKTPSGQIRNAMSARMWSALKGRTDGALFSRLGYTLPELMAHLEAKFQPGMDWDNYGRWHVDHIRPCASFDLTDEAQFSACWALANLQPLWARDNIRKGAKHGAP